MSKVRGYADRRLTRSDWLRMHMTSNRAEIQKIQIGAAVRRLLWDLMRHQLCPATKLQCPGLAEAHYEIRPQPCQSRYAPTSLAVVIFVRKLFSELSLVRYSAVDFYASVKTQAILPDNLHTPFEEYPMITTAAIYDDTGPSECIVFGVTCC